MLDVETIVELPEIINQIPMYPDRKTDVRDWKVLKVCGDGLVVDAEGREYELNSLEKITDMVMGRVCIFSEEQNDFNKIIKYLGEDIILEIAKNRKIKKNGLTVSVQDNVGREFSFRKGNRFGWCRNIPDVFEENIDVKTMSIQYEEMLNTLRSSGFAISSLSSAPKMAQNFFHSNLRGFIPSLDELDRKHWERASYATKGGRMECAKLGEFKNVYDYDMVSAYGSLLKDLPCISPYYMKWFSSRQYHPEADMAFCLCEVNMPLYEDGFAPFRMDFGNVFFPYGKFGTWLAKPEIDALLMLGIDVKIREGSFGKIIKEFRPFERITDNLWELKNYPFCYKVAKGMLSKGWGKFLSVYDNGKVSSLWNPIYAAHITSMARARLLELTRLVGENNLVVFSIDGFSSKRPLPEHLLSDNMGGMKLHYTGAMTSYTDFFRDVGQKKSWEITDDGVYFEGSGYVSIFGMKVFRYEDICKPIQVSRCIPFGSTKRGGQDLKLKDILNNEIRLSPPHVKDVRDMYEKAIERDLIAANPFLLEI